jgi:hypothetical protein
MKKVSMVKPNTTHQQTSRSNQDRKLTTLTMKTDLNKTKEYDYRGQLLDTDEDYPSEESSEGQVERKLRRLLREKDREIDNLTDQKF